MSYSKYEWEKLFKKTPKNETRHQAIFDEAIARLKQAKIYTWELIELYNRIDNNSGAL